MESDENRLARLAIEHQEVPRDLEALLDKTDKILRKKKASFDGKKNPSTDLDTEIDSILKAGIKEVLNVPFFSEETPDATTSGELYWVVDAIDGTLNSIVDNENYVTSIALVDQVTNEAVVSTLSSPQLNLRIEAIKSKGCQVNGVYLKPKPIDRPNIIAYGLPVDADKIASIVGEKITNLIKNDWILRQTGSAALDICRVALGQWKGYFQPGIYLWDTVGAELVTKEAGGVVIRCNAEKYRDPHRFDILVCNEADQLNLQKMLLEDS